VPQTVRRYGLVASYSVKKDHTTAKTITQKYVAASSSSAQIAGRVGEGVEPA